MINLNACEAFVAIGVVFGIILGAVLGALVDRSKLQLTEPFVDLNSKCPGCGHNGCTLECIPAQEVSLGDEKGKTKITEPMIRRICKTCGAMAYQKTVWPVEKWIAK